MSAMFGENQWASILQLFNLFICELWLEDNFTSRVKYSSFGIFIKDLFFCEDSPYEIQIVYNFICQLVCRSSKKICIYVGFRESYLFICSIFLPWPLKISSKPSCLTMNFVYFFFSISCSNFLCFVYFAHNFNQLRYKTVKGLSNTTSYSQLKISVFCLMLVKKTHCQINLCTEDNNEYLLL